MTAEVAVLNKSAIALAADSAVTIGNLERHKIFNSANKIFTLSKNHPVGIMIYSSAELMGVPWEIIIKVYRKELREKNFDYLKDYANDFIKFISNSRELFKSELKDEFVNDMVGSFFLDLKKNICKEIDKKIKEKSPLSGKEYLPIISNSITNYYNDFKKEEDMLCFSKGFTKKFLKKYEKLILDIKKEVFQKLPLSDNDNEKLMKIACFFFTKENYFGGALPETGVVIAGFGEKEKFPRLYHFTADFVVMNSLRFTSIEKMEVSQKNPVAIIPFAQKEMVSSFMEGIAPNYKMFLMKSMKDLFFKKMPNILIDEIFNITDVNKNKEHREKLNELSEGILEEFIKSFDKFQQLYFTQPIVNGVSYLPKDELAAMSESFVHLTSLKRKISANDVETVGGPIDVAVISKGDGFIWIKRKHYFDLKYNPNFYNIYNEKRKGVKNGK